jgi:hypothetical protein
MKSISFLPAIVLASATVMQSPDAFAWGATGHRMIGELVSGALPLEVPAFLRNPEAGRQIGEVAREPDRSKGTGDPHDADAPMPIPDTASSWVTI